MNYLPHQIEKSDELYAVMKKYHMACLWGEPRSGKTRTAIRTVTLSSAKNILVLTKKNAILGWSEEIAAVAPGLNFHVTNYEQVKNLDGAYYDVVIIDESHNLNKTGRPTQRFKDVRKLAYNKPVIFLTGTPAIEKRAGIFHQLGVTKYSPFAGFKNFYKFFHEYGVPNPMWINGRSIEPYNRVTEDLMPAIDPYVVRMTQIDAGITSAAEDVVHRVALSENTKDLIHRVMLHGVATINGAQYGFDSDMGVRAAVHQIESGAVLLDGNLVELDNTEIIDYIRETFGDHSGVGVMAHYRSTREKIKRHLPNVTVYSSDGHAEGVNLSHLDHFVIMNSAYSGAKFVQRRERIVNINRTTNAIVHHIITDGGVSAGVYTTLSAKKNYNVGVFRDARAKHSEDNN